MENEDEFWDLDKIIPQRPKAESSFDEPDTSSVEITFGKGESDVGKPVPERHIKAKSIIDTYENRSGRLIISYEPKCKSITSVKVYSWPVKYTFYEKFVSDGEKYYKASIPDDCPYTPFFSYMPQYNQLNIRQMRYYIKWRSSFRKKDPLPTDFSYVLLFIYELLNLERMSTPEKRLNMLCDIWLYYREQFPHLNKYLTEWVCDFCLLHRLPPPTERLKAILPDIYRISSLREFYTDDQLPYSMESYITSSSSYNYLRSTVVNAENEDIFKKHVIRAGAYALEKAQDGDASQNTPELIRISRSSYSGALCTPDVKRRIDIDCYRVKQNVKYKNEITALVRYCENGVRAHLGIKSRISSSGLSDELMKYANEYFEAELPPLRTPTQKRLADEERRYALYDTDTSDFTTDDALMLEKASWEITKELVTLDEDEPKTEINEPVTDIPMQLSDSESVYDTLLRALQPLLFDVLRLILNGKRAQAERLCVENGAFFDGAVQQINELSCDITDDIIIENGAVVQDYEELLRSAFERIEL